MRIIAVVGIALMLASCVSGGDRSADREQFNRVRGKAVANPSAIVKAELSFARLAREEGQWTAFRETATDDAVMFTPNLVNAQEWLKGKADPAEAVDWQPHKIYMSCDGTLAVSTGAWQDAKGGTGQFFTIWQQQEATQKQRARGEDWKWVFDHGVSVDEPLAEPDFVETEVADCADKNALIAVPRPLSSSGRSGKSRDNSLIWTAAVRPNGSWFLKVDLLKSDSFVNVIKEEFAASE